jgi:D-alanyl-D-alanine carboxypeptidase (penicillin-binding protein 5/6)
VALAVASLLAVPVAASAAGTTAGTTSVTAEVVGGPDLAAPGVVVHPGAGATALPVVDADTWLLADLTTGQVLAAKGAHSRVLPASTLKTLTAVTLMPKLDKTQVVTATYDQAKADGGHVGIVPGATYSIWDLWHGLLLPSANDAAAALADANGGMATTVRDMQAMALSLGAHDTVVKNDSGLDARGQVSSAYDMALFARAALAIPDFAKVTKTFHYGFPGRPARGTATRKTYQIYTQNRLLVHGYKGVIGGKTGFTSLAHRTYWGAASRGGHVLVATLFQIHEPTEAAAKKLLTWGFANLAKVTPVGTLVGPHDGTSTAASASGEQSPAAVAAGGGTTAAGGPTVAAGSGAPWAPIVAVVGLLALVGGGVLWWRRREPDYAGTLPAAVLTTGTAAPSTPRPAHAAARTSPSVVVSGGRHATQAATPQATAATPAVGAPAVDAPTVDATTVDSPTVDSPTVDTATVGTATVERPAVEPAAEVPAPQPPTAGPLVVDPPAPRPQTGGHVRIITPPGRTPGA